MRNRREWDRGWWVSRTCRLPPARDPGVDRGTRLASSLAWRRRCGRWGGGCQRRAKCLLLALVEGGANHRAAFALQGREDLVGRHLADQQEEHGIPRLQALCGIPHEPIVDADIGKRAAERPRRRSDRGASQRHQEDHTDQSAPECPRNGAGCSWVEELIEFDMAIGLLPRDHRITQLDQVLLLHIEQLLANLLVFFFGRKCDFHEIGHLCLLHAVRIERRRLSRELHPSPGYPPIATLSRRKKRVVPAGQAAARVIL